MAKSEYPDGEELHTILWSIVHYLRNDNTNSIPCYFDDKIVIVKGNEMRVYLRGIGSERLAYINIDNLKCVFLYVDKLQTPVQKYNPGHWVKYVQKLFDEKVVLLRKAKIEQDEQEKLKEELEKFGKVDDSDVFR